MRINRSIIVQAPAADVFAFIREPDSYPCFMSGITRWQVEGDPRGGLGARYRMLMRVGSAEVGGLIEIVEEIEDRELAWTSVTGIDQRGRWRLRERRPGTTSVELRFSYGVAGAGIPGWIAELVSSRAIKGNMQTSLEELKRQVEQRRSRDRRERGLRQAPA